MKSVLVHSYENNIHIYGACPLFMADFFIKMFPQMFHDVSEENQVPLHSLPPQIVSQVLELLQTNSIIYVTCKFKARNQNDDFSVRTGFEPNNDIFVCGTYYATDYYISEELTDLAYPTD